MSPNSVPTAAAVLRTLNDPVRRGMYDFISKRAEPVGRDVVAAEAQIGRTLAAYHLDKLAAAGLLDVSYARPAGRSGPGAGRPAKLYALAKEEISVTIPPRNYQLLGGLLAAAAGMDDSGVVHRALLKAARQQGIELGLATGDTEATLGKIGYEPQRESNGNLTVANCPFHLVAQEQTQLVCSMNHALIQGVLEGCRCDAGRANLEPQAGRCCVVIHPAAPATP